MKPVLFLPFHSPQEICKIVGFFNESQVNMGAHGHYKEPHDQEMDHSHDPKTADPQIERSEKGDTGPVESKTTDCL